MKVTASSIFPLATLTLTYDSVLTGKASGKEHHQSAAAGSAAAPREKGRFSPVRLHSLASVTPH